MSYAGAHMFTLVRPVCQYTKITITLSDSAGKVMSITITWDNELDNAVFYRFDGRWTWEEFLNGFVRETHMAASLAGQRYDVVAEIVRGTNLPAGPAIAHVYGVYRRYPANWGVTVVATASPFIRAMFNVGYSVHPDVRDRFLVADSLEAAREMIQARRTQLASPALSYQSR